jgi:hypothetical protein
MTLKVFISYAKENQAKAEEYYDFFTSEGVSPWMDKKKLLPGQNWEVEISRAFKNADLIVLLLSKISVNKRGFVQREANDAIEGLRYKQPGDIYVMPLLLEPCDVPDNIANRLQYIDMNTSGAWAKVQESLKTAAKQQSIELERGVTVGVFTMFTEKLEEKWEGLPGHDISIEYPRFESSLKPQCAKELTEFFSGRAFSTLINNRQKPWEQDSEWFSEKTSFSAANGRWDGFVIVHATNCFLSLTYDVGWYGAGAIHPNSFFETFNFAYKDEQLYRLELDDFFIDMEKAIKIISEKCIYELSKKYWERTGEKPDESQINWFKEGAGEDISNFVHFTVSDDCFTFLFAPYQVSCYAMGTWSAIVSFFELFDIMNPNVLSLICKKKLE